MDVNTMLKIMLSEDSVHSVSARTGASDEEVRSILTSALPAMLAGAQQQSVGSDTAESFAAALTQHGEENTMDLSSYLGNVDMDDGAKIVQHLLGTQGAGTVAAQTGVSSNTTSSVMSMAAPLLLSLLGQESKKKKKKKPASGSSATTTSDASDLMSTLLSNVDTTSLILSLLGVESSGKKKKKKKKAGGDVLDLLGSLLK